MKARIKLVDGMAFMAESGSGHAVVVDGAPEIGGRNLGARPMELVLMGTGACSAIDVVHILRKGRSNLTGLKADLTGHRTSETPHRFVSVDLHFTVTGNVPADQIQRAIDLSREKYCSVWHSMRQDIEFNVTFEVMTAV